MENLKICRACAASGKCTCCQNIPGTVWPEQVFDTGNDQVAVDAVASMLAGGRYCADWWDGDTEPGFELERVMYLRPAIQGHVGCLEHPTWGREGDCIFLAADGCSLDHDDRPRQCQELVPIDGGGCDLPDEFSKNSGARAWRPYQEIIARALEVARARRAK